MKNIFYILLLLPTIIFAQYPSNSGQKITLGEQTTADGLVYRGVANDTNVITPFSDTSAYIILDTVNSKFYHYNRTTTFWSLAGGGGDSGGVTSFSAGTTGLTPSTATTGAVTLGGTLAVANGGTGKSSLTANKILVGSGTDTIKSPTNLHWDNTNSRLGINNNSPSGSLDVIGNIFLRGYTDVGSSSNIQNNYLRVIDGSVRFKLQSLNNQSIAYMGTETNHSVTFISNNEPVFYITNSGRIGVGSQFPTALLEIKAGTAAQYGAPLKFTSGVSLEVPEVGAMEFSNISGTNKLYISPANNVRKEIAYTDFTNASGVLPVANGGTGSASYQSTAVPYYIQGTKLSNDTSIIKVDTINKRVILSGLAIYDGNGTGLNNVVLGNLSMLNNTTGNTNVALGSLSLQNNTTGTENLAIGNASLNLNTTGQFNIGIGSQSLSKNTTALRNIGIGRTSLEDHKTGDDNIGIGYLALANDTISAFNLAIGNNAMATLIGNASNNTSIGHGSMLLKTSGSGNVALGHYAGYLNTTGSNNIWIGEVYTGSSNTASNEVTVGNSSTTSYRIFQSGWTNVSDVRDKTDILPLNYGLNFIEKLKPVTYTWNMRDGGKIGIADIGFIAQDLEKTQIDLGINVPNLVNTENPEQYGISTINLLPIIVKALQEANDKIKSLEQKIINLENK